LTHAQAPTPPRSHILASLRLPINTRHYRRRPWCFPEGSAGNLLSRRVETPIASLDIAAPAAHAFRRKPCFRLSACNTRAALRRLLRNRRWWR